MDFSMERITNSTVHLEKVEPLNQKRTLAFFNHWAITTVDFLNKFSSTCETKLNELDTKLQRTEDALAILEAKLSSIPGLETITIPANSQTPPAPSPPTDPQQQPPPAPSSSAEVPAAPTDTSAPVVATEGEPIDTSAPMAATGGAQPPTPVSKHPRYASFFKMVAVGVPAPAVKIKMASQGLDPSLLDDPDAPAPEGAPNDHKSDSEGEISSWSDD